MEEKGNKTAAREEYLTREEKKRLIDIFNNKADYIRHMRTLWALRAEALKRCEKEKPAGLSWDKTNPLFRLGDLANELIGALEVEHREIFFDDSGNCWEGSAAEAHINSPRNEDKPFLM